MNCETLVGKKVLITAGPTREAIDPVRYISNHSSGKMGYAIADRFLETGAEVTIISGPVSLGNKFTSNNHAQKLKIIKVESAGEMYLACCHFFEQADIVVFAAAVADYRPKIISTKKIKKDNEIFNMQLVKNIDIALEFGRVKTFEQISVGFALETNDELNNAINKLAKKSFDMVILNSMNDDGATFGYDSNKITIVKKDLSIEIFPLKSKTDVATDIVNEIEKLVSRERTYAGNKMLI
jgi:phosphopantothenoylcysteine decarboxylase/phosphopantothenate--cysteine ligase